MLVLETSGYYVSAQDSSNQGITYLKELQFGRAETWFQNKLKNSPGDVEALIGLGDTYLAINKADSAKTMFQKAITLNSKNPFALVGMGKAALISHDRMSETAYFDRARRAGKTNPEVYCAVADGCMNLTVQDTVTALLFINQGLSINHKYAALHLSTGNLEWLKKNYGLAANAYDRAIFFDPKSAIAYRNLGCVNVIMRSHRDALKAFNKSIEINPDQVLVYKYLGDLLYTTGKYADAERAYQAYNVRAELTSDDKERYAIILFFNKKYGEAAALLEQILATDQDASVLLRIRGYIACETGDFQKGLEYMTKFFSLHDPAKVIATDYLYYAKILQNLGDESKSLDNYKKAIALDPTKTEIYEQMAKLSAKSNQHKEAAFYYQKMAEYGADKLSATFQAGKEFYFEADNWKMRYDSLKKLGQTKQAGFTDSLVVKENIKTFYTKADSAFTVVTQLSAQSSGGYLWKGRIQSLLHPEAENEGAREAYEKALSLLLNGDPASNKKFIIECYRYLGYYHFLGYEKLFTTNRQRAGEMRAKSIDYFTKISKLDPTDAQAKDVLSKMKSK
jgi:tetratricopeptide (TPR) repeat protein